MKKMFTILVALVMLMSCAHYGSLNHQKIKSDVYIDTDYSWINNSPTHGYMTGLRAVTIRLINRKYRDVDVKIRCEYIDKVLFGETIATVKARNDKTIVVRGLARSPLFVERATCFITSIR
jgi:hypothetical protein